MKQLNNNLKLALKRTFPVILLGVFVFLSFPTETFAQQTVKGIVEDTTAKPIEGVSVFVKGNAEVNAITDQNGRYSINVRSLLDTLVFRIVGMTTRQVPINGSASVNVVMKSSSQELSNVVIIGFGKEKRSDLVGSVSSVNPHDLKVPSSNLTTALAGRIPGLVSFQRSGEPGADNAEFFIRGVTTFGYNVNPLILIDGIESSTTDLARLQVDDIESFSILKDATATAIYGSRGANGVILIKTKGGTEGKTHIFFRLENSVSMPTENVKLVDPIHYMELNNEAVQTRDPLAALPYPETKIDNTIRNTDPVMYPIVDWQKALLKKYTTNQRAYLNITGGGKKARFFVSGAVDQDNGILKVPSLNNFNNNINLKSYSLRANVNMQLFKYTQLNVNISGNFDDYTGPLDGGTKVYHDIMRTTPTWFLPFYDPGEKYDYLKHIMFGNYLDGKDMYLNPYADMVKGYKNYSQSRMLAQLELSQDFSFITEGLDLRLMGYTTRNAYFSISRSYNPFYYQIQGPDPIEAGEYVFTGLNEDDGTEFIQYAGSDKLVSSVFYLEAALNYKRTFQKKHAVSGLLVYTLRNLLEGNAGDLQQSLPFRNLGLAGRFTYAYSSRYFLQLNFGYNGSERFSKANRFGFFPSAGLAWTVSNEAFWKDMKPVVSNLRLRYTYGLVGNDQIGPSSSRFYYLSEIDMNSTARSSLFGELFNETENGVSIKRYPNPDITWETAYKSNLGIEIGLWNRLNLTADLYREHRKNIFMTRDHVPSQIGLEVSVAANVGEALGEGIDLHLDYDKSFSNGIWLKVMANFTYAHSEYTVYEEPDYEKTPWLSRVGYPISQQWGLVAERLFIDSAEVERSPEQEFGKVMAGDIKYMDINGDGKVDDLDRIPIGWPTTPEINYGFGFSLGYKNWDLSMFFEGLSRESFWIDQNATAPFLSYAYSGESFPGGTILKNEMLEAYAKSHWSESNQDLYAIWPRLSNKQVDNNAQLSTWFMRNGDFLRLKQLEIGYSLPAGLMDRWKIESLRFYLNGSNLFLWSRFKLWDIEMAGNGLGYPLQKVFNIGAQITL